MGATKLADNQNQWTQPPITDFTQAQHDHSSASKGGAVAGSSLAALNTLQDNLMLLAFRQEYANSYAIEKLEQGMVDEFIDSSGIDAANSINQQYDAANKIVMPAGQIDSYTSLMLHMDGSNGGTTFTDSSTNALTPSLNGTPTTSTAQKKFGTASGLFPSSSWLQYSTLTPFQVGNADFTIDCLINVPSLASGFTICGLYQDSNNGYSLNWDPTNGMYFKVVSGGSIILDVYTVGGASGWSINTWYHVAVVRYGNVWTIYRDGTAVATLTQNTTVPTFTGSFDVGAGNLTYAANGYIDEFRFSKGIARWTANFTSPASAYSAATDNMTLISAAQSALSAPTSARVVLLEEDIDVCTINTDILAYASKDGSTYSQITLASEGNYDSSKVVYAGTVDISGQPSGTTPKVKLVSANNKNFKLHGWALNWS